MGVIGRRAHAQHILDDALGLALQSRVEAGAHHQHALLAQLAVVGERLDLVIGEVEIIVRAAARAMIDRGRRIAPRRVDLALGHEARVDQVAEHVVGARPGGGQVHVGRIFGRRLEQARQHRRLRQVDVARRLAKIELRRRLHAEGAPPI